VKRRLFNRAAAVSLVLLLATLALWVRSHFAQEWIVYQSTEPRRWWQVTFVSDSGLFYFSKPQYDFVVDGAAAQYSSHYGRPNGWLYLRQPPDWQSWEHTRLGFMVIVNDVTNRPDGTQTFPRAFIPYWFVALLTATAPAIWFIRHRRTRRPSRRQLLPRLRLRPSRVARPLPRMRGERADQDDEWGNGSARIRTENQGIMSPLL
jgi:hypothetical protein